jgi:hypothetical protein
MDFGLIKRHSSNYLLRDILAFQNHWVYYGAIVIDPILRLSWISVVVLTYNIQHNGLLSFVVACVEIVRRGIWILIRFENEHCVNIAQHRASRDISLPYQIEVLKDSEDDEEWNGGVDKHASKIYQKASGSEVLTPHVEEGMVFRKGSIAKLRP